MRRRAGSCLPPPACLRAPALALVPARNQHDKRAEQPIAAANRRLTHTTDPTSMRLARLNCLSIIALREGDRPILFVTGATGFAPVKSIVEDAFQRGLRRPMWLYWGVRRRQDLYRATSPNDGSASTTISISCRCCRTPSRPTRGQAGAVWSTRRCSWIFPDMRGYEVYVCGSVKMVEAAVPAFIQHGLGEDLCSFDAFTPPVAAPASRPV